MDDDQILCRDGVQAVFGDLGGGDLESLQLPLEDGHRALLGRLQGRVVGRSHLGIEGFDQVHQGNHRGFRVLDHRVEAIEHRPEAI